MGTLEVRIRTLEQENRRLKLAGVGLLGVLGAGLIMGQAAKPQVTDLIRARRIEVVDGHGTVRARIATTPDDQTVDLTLYDQLAIKRTALSAKSKASFVSLFHESGSEAASLLSVDFDSHSSSMLVLSDPAAQNRTTVSADIRGGELTIRNTSGGKMLDLSAIEDHANLDLQDTIANARASLSTVQGSAALKLVDGEGYASTFGTSELMTPTTGTKTKRSAASAVMFDKEQKVIWQAP